MSKFNNPIRTLSLPRAPLMMTPPELRPAAPAVAPAPVAVDAITLERRIEPATVGIGFALLCTLLISQYLNEWSLRLVGTSAYVSSIAIVLCPIFYFLSGNAFRGFKDKVGIWWLLYALLILLGVPFSVWRTGSLMVLKDYVARAWVLFFYAAAFVTTVKRCRTIMMVSVVCATILLLTCRLFGEADETGRFHLPGSPFFNNANDLGLQLALSICLFLFLIILGGKFRTVAGVAGILFSLMYMLRTGSRGCAVSVVCLFLIVFWATRRKVQLLMLMAPLIMIAVLVAPSASLERLALIVDPPKITKWEDIGAIESKMERQELIKMSLFYTVTHPVFGVGAGQFPVAITGDAEKKGEHSPWLGTHNTYTQVSAECGIPALICYLFIIIISIKRTHAVYRFAAGKKEYREIEALSFCLFASIAVYAIATFFYHMAFSSMLPLLTGQAMALSSAMEPLMAGRTTRQAAAA